MMAAGLRAKPMATGSRVAMSDELMGISSGVDGERGEARQPPVVVTRTGGAVQLPSRIAGPGR